MQVFVANQTLQHRELHYRVPNGTRVLFIPMGKQMVLSENLDGASLQSVIDQLHQAGAIPHTEVNEITRPHSLLYRVSKHIDSDVIDEGRARDTEARQDVAAQQMENAGLAAYGIAEKIGSVVETSVEITETTDVATVKGGVDYEVTVSAKPGKAGKKTTMDKPRSRRG